APLAVAGGLARKLRRRGVGLLLVLARLPGDRVLELAHARAQGAPKPGPALGADAQEHDRQYQDELEGTDSERHGISVAGPREATSCTSPRCATRRGSTRPTGSKRETPRGG